MPPKPKESPKLPPAKDATGKKGEGSKTDGKGLKAKAEEKTSPRLEDEKRAEILLPGQADTMKMKRRGSVSSDQAPREEGKKEDRRRRPPTPKEESKKKIPEAREKLMTAFEDFLTMNQISSIFKVIIAEILSERPARPFDYIALRLREIGAYRQQQRFKAIESLIPMNLPPPARRPVKLPDLLPESVEPPPKFFFEEDGMGPRQKTQEEVSPNEGIEALDATALWLLQDVAYKWTNKSADKFATAEAYLFDPATMKGLWDQIKQMDRKGTEGGSSTMHPTLGPNQVTLAQAFKVLLSRYPVMQRRLASTLAYKRIALPQGGLTGSDYITERELPNFAQNAVMFNKMLAAFGESPVLSAKQFATGFKRMGLTPEEAEETYTKLSSQHEAGTVTFEAVSEWYLMQRGMNPSIRKNTTSTTAGTKKKTLPPPDPTLLAKLDAMELEMRQLETNPAELEKLWLTMGPDKKTGAATLGVLHGWFWQKFPHLALKTSMYRAFKHIYNPEGGRPTDAFLEIELGPLLVLAALCSRVCGVFGVNDVDDSRTMDSVEFAHNTLRLGLSLTSEQCAITYKEMCPTANQLLRFERFAEWYFEREGFPKEAKLRPLLGEIMGPSVNGAQNKKTDAQIVEEFNKIRNQIEGLLESQTKLEDFWKRAGAKMNKVLLKEVGRVITEIYPHVSRKAALLSCFKYTTGKIAKADLSDQLSKTEVPTLLKNLVAFNKLYAVFDDVMGCGAKGVGFKAFKAGMAVLGLQMSDDEAREQFEGMEKNSAGKIMFSEFCEWFVSQSQF